MYTVFIFTCQIIFMPDNLFQPKALVLQWHITERCNWRCKHCYQESYATPEMNLEKMADILNQYTGLVKKWGIPPNRARLAITGGEPLLRNDFLNFAGKIYGLSDAFHWVLMSNGSLLTKELAKTLKLFGLSGFQVSLEGTQKSNDKIRGPGAFQKTLKAIELLTETDIPTRVSLSLTKSNQFQIRELADILAPLGTRAIAARRIVPWGSGAQLKNDVLEPLELKAFYGQVEQINRDLAEKDIGFKVLGGCENGVFNDEISGPGLMSFNRCGVVEGRVLIVLPNGDVLPCRRLPIVIGNLYKKSLEEIYYSPAYENWRQQKDLTDDCHSCSNFQNCLGGAKCVTYALTGQTAPDVQCWKLFNSLEEAIKKISR